MEPDSLPLGLDAAAFGCLVALGIGLLIGVDRERRKHDGVLKEAAGVRTFALVALLGAVSAVLGTAIKALAVLAMAAFAVAAYLRDAQADRGLTTEVAMVLTALLGALAPSRPALAALLGVLIAVLLAAKQAMHRFTTELISERELRDGLILAAAALVVLPLLPRDGFGPGEVFNPYDLWRLVVLLLAVGMLGHLAQRTLGPRWGLPAAGFFAGFASSTAATAAFGRLCAARAGTTLYAAAAALLANLASLLLMCGVIGAVSPALLRDAAWPLAAAAAVLVAGGALGLRHADGGTVESLARDERAFRLRHALLLALAIAAVLAISTLAQHWFGNIGAIAAATLAALAELHAAAATVAKLAQSQALPLADARWAVVALLAAAAVAKSILALVSGGARYGAGVAAGLIASVAAAALAA